MHGDVCLSSCFGVWAVSTTLAAITAFLSCGIHMRSGRWSSQVYSCNRGWWWEWILQVDPIVSLRPPVDYCFCSTIFWDVRHNEDSACSLYAFLLHPQRAFVSDGPQLVDLTFRDDMPLTLTRADYQYIFVHPNMGRLLLVRSNVITWVELIEDLSR